ncbi:hypothetical protein GTP58_30380 [Duganella sp. CY15W]|uniref:hypothetical protein n=1 Tax=Duganella sp. CY15W TaxID=2692172 RepID=UPI00136B9765|nr:hypothetical protein [Duganella sp. CY15W]MYM32648.1 hypothetical protein [Duganella sp. CY15W]
MSSIGTCRLCQTAGATLLGSHIVPEFFYKRVYTKSHKFTAIPLEDEKRLAIEQKGYREDLLCANCETKLSKWEGKLSQFVSQVVSGAYTTCKATQHGIVTAVSGVDYSSVKMAVISIFWRMSIAKHKLFGSYSLGPYEEQFRNLLDQAAVPAETEFPILLSKGLLDGQFLPGILFPMSRGMYDNTLVLQSVVLNGIVFDCVMTKTRAIPKEMAAFALQASGGILIASRSYEDLGVDIGEVSKRMRRADVKAFYQKHS